MRANRVPIRDLIFKELKGKFVLTGPVAQVLEISFSVKDVDHRAEGEIVRLQIAPADLLKDLSGFLIKGTEFFASIRTMNSKRTVDTSSIEKVLIAGSGRGFFARLRNCISILPLHTKFSRSLPSVSTAPQK